MNPIDAPDKSSDAIRSEIDETRQQMDTTIDALSERLKGRHLIDEVLGFFRSNGGNAASTLKDKVAEKTNATVNVVVDTVKAHPIPVLVVGAGLAWLIYEQTKKRQATLEYDDDLGDERLTYPSADSSMDTVGYDPDDAGLGAYTRDDFEDEASVESPSGYGAGLEGRTDEMKRGLQTRATDAKNLIQDKASALGDKARQGMQSVKQRAQDMKDRTVQATAEVRDHAKQLAGRTKEQITRISDEHPLETGVACLALGLVAGMLTPTPERVRSELAPAARRLKTRVTNAGSDLVNRGKHVVEAAAHAAREEAEKQGLTPEAMGARAQEMAGADQPAGSRKNRGSTAQASAEMAPSDNEEANEPTRGPQVTPPQCPPGPLI